MEFVPLSFRAMSVQKVRGMPICHPNSSMPMMTEATGVRVAAAKSAIMEMPAKRSTGASSHHASEFPSAAPMKKRGVTSPPLNPAESVATVNTSFHSHAVAGAWVSGERNLSLLFADAAEDHVIAGTEVVAVMPVVKTHRRAREGKQVDEPRQGEALPRRGVQRPQEKRGGRSDHRGHHREAHDPFQWLSRGHQCAG